MCLMVFVGTGWNGMEWKTWHFLCLYPDPFSDLAVRCQDTGEAHALYSRTPTRRFPVQVVHKMVPIHL